MSVPTMPSNLIFDCHCIDARQRVRLYALTTQNSIHYLPIDKGHKLFVHVCINTRDVTAVFALFVLKSTTFDVFTIQLV